MARELTEKQKAFCKNVVSGMSYKDSYINAYNCDSDNAAYVEGSKLALREDVQEYIRALRKPIEKAVINKVITEREKIKSKLWDIINDEGTSPADKIRSMDVLNRMNQEYININKNLDDTKSEINNVDTEKLFKLIG